MKTKFNFNSQVCTSRLQSEKLLALGLKKETADMYWLRMVKDYKGDDIPTIRDKWWLSFVGFTVGAGFEQYECIPAWSLHRLIEMMPREIECDVENGLSINLFNRGYDAVTYYEVIGYYTDKNLYNAIIACMEELIKEGYFPKEYLD